MGEGQPFVRIEDEDRVWSTRDGRELPLEEMPAPHIGAASNVLKNWLKGEDDPEVRRDLSRWRKLFGKELSKRRKEWMARNGSKRD